MSTEITEEIKAIRVLPFSGQQGDWDEWSEKYQGIAVERGYLKIMLGIKRVPIDADQKVGRCPSTGSTHILSLNQLTIRPSQWPKRHFFERCVKCIQTNHCHH